MPEGLMRLEAALPGAVAYSHHLSTAPCFLTPGFFLLPSPVFAEETNYPLFELSRNFLLAEFTQKIGGCSISLQKIIACPTAREVGLESLDGLLIQRSLEVVGEQICDLFTADHSVPP
ncbi:MAG: hypothetical protein V3T26_04535, partial [candidate division NC10 bacterium]